MSPETVDLKMRLLAGESIYVGDIPIKPLSLRQISQVGYSKFQQSIGIISITLDEMIESIDDFEMQAQLKAERHLYKVFDMYMLSNDMQELVLKSFNLLFQTDNVIIDGELLDDMSVVIDEKYVINRDNFDDVVNMIQLQNNPEKSASDEDDYNPANELAKSIAEKLKRSKEIVEKSKALESDGDGLTIPDIISAVSAMSNSLNKLNIWDLTIYQLYDEFARLTKIDNYRLQIQASMWSSDIEIEHWSEPI